MKVLYSLILEFRLLGIWVLNLNILGQSKSLSVFKIFCNIKAKCKPYLFIIIATTLVFYFLHHSLMNTWIIMNRFSENKNRKKRMKKMEGRQWQYIFNYRWVSSFFVVNIFIPFKVYNSVVFSIFIELGVYLMHYDFLSLKISLFLL